MPAKLGHHVKVISISPTHTYLDFKVIEYMQLGKCYIKVLSLQGLSLNWNCAVQIKLKMMDQVQDKLSDNALEV